MFNWIRRKLGEFKSRREETDRLRAENLRQISVATPEQLDQATVCLDNITLKRAGTRSLRGK